MDLKAPDDINCLSTENFDHKIGLLYRRITSERVKDRPSSLFFPDVQIEISSSSRMSAKFSKICGQNFVLV